jgi:hypothetical protein
VEEEVWREKKIAEEGEGQRGGEEDQCSSEERGSGKRLREEENLNQWRCGLI